MIDLHFHVLWGIDDGPSTPEASVALARAASELGTTTIVATPHVSWRYPNEAATIEQALSALRARLTQDGVTVEIRSGAEIAMTRVSEMEPEQLRQLGLGGGSWLLLEPPFAPVATGLERIVHGLWARGHRVLLAHPERCPAFHRDPQALRSLVSEGALTSVTAGALVGRFGKSVQRFAAQMLREGLVHNVASDAHDRDGRAPGILRELSQAGLTPLAGWLTEEVPAAILADHEAPSPPKGHLTAGAQRRRWWQRG